MKMFLVALFFVLCYILCITNITKDVKVGDKMVVTIDFNSDEALYIQLRNQIIIGIANEQLQEGESLPSVRELADNIGINMHTVNKAYTILKQEGYLKLDRRRGAVIAIDIDKLQAKAQMQEEMKVILAKGICKGISCQEAHQIIDHIFSEFNKEG